MNETWTPEIAMLPCPFCGCADIQGENEWGNNQVYCRGCQASLSADPWGPDGRMLDEAAYRRRIAEAWNRRVTPSAGPPCPGR